MILVQFLHLAKISEISYSPRKSSRERLTWSTTAETRKRHHMFHFSRAKSMALKEAKEDRQNRRKKGRKQTHRPITKLSGEQVIIAQLQGSTESSSQLFNTPCGSSKASLILIKASTANPQNQNITLIIKYKDKYLQNLRSSNLHGYEARRTDRV